MNNQAEAKAAFVSNAKLARALLQELNVTLSKAINDAMPAPHWGHVGDLADMTKTLAGLVARFELTPEDTEEAKAAEVSARALAAWGR